MNKLVLISQLTYDFIQNHNFSSLELKNELNNFPILDIIDIDAYVLGVQAFMIVQSKLFNLDTKDKEINKFLEVSDNIPNAIIKNTFYKFFLNFYIKNDIVLSYRNTVDKIINLIVPGITENMYLFYLPILESSNEN